MSFYWIISLLKTLLVKVTKAVWSETKETWLYIRYICTIYWVYTYVTYTLLGVPELNCLIHFPQILLLCIWYDMKVVGDTYMNETLTMRFKFPFHLFLIFQTKRLMYHTHTHPIRYPKWLLHVYPGRWRRREGAAVVLASSAVCHVLVKLKTITYSNLLLLCCTSFKLLLLLFPYKVKLWAWPRLASPLPVWVYFN